MAYLELGGYKHTVRRCLPALSWFTLLALFTSFILIGVTRATRNFARRQQLNNLRRLGLINRSNLADQYDAKYTKLAQEKDDESVHIKALFVHPIKSCGPVELSSAILVRTGFAYDRVFALAEEVHVDDGKGRPDHSQPKIWRMRSQRNYPDMSSVSVEVWVPHDGSNPNDPLVQSGGCLVVSFPNPHISSISDCLVSLLETWRLTSAPRYRFVVPMLPTVAYIDQFKLKRRDFKVHGRTQEGLDMGNLDTIAAALPKLRAHLGIPADNGFTLMRCMPDALALTELNLAPRHVLGYRPMHGFTDQQPLNLNSLASVHAVSALLPPESRPLNAGRFRPNIWISGAPAFAEDFWKRFRVMPSVGVAGRRADIAPGISVVCRTMRCTLTNVDPATGRITKDERRRAQPLSTLSMHRKVDSGKDGAFLGVHCVPEGRAFDEAKEKGSDIYVAVGDEIEVLETGEHVYGSTAGEY